MMPPIVVLIRARSNNVPGDGADCGTDEGAFTGPPSAVAITVAVAAADRGTKTCSGKGSGNRSCSLMRPPRVATWKEKKGSEEYRGKARNLHGFGPDG